MPWWATQVEDYARHLYVGHGAYKIGDWPENEIPRQVSLNRETNSSLGSIYFSYSDIKDNLKGSLDSLKNNYYKYLAIPPRMNWKDSFYAYSMTNLSDCNHRVDTLAMFSSNNQTFKDLDSLFIAFLNLLMNPDCIAGSNFRNFF